MAPVHHVHVLERGHVETLCCTNSRAFFVLYVRLFYFLDRSVLFSAIKMHVRLIISSQVMNAAEYCALVKNTASWLVQPFAGAADSKWGVSHQSSFMGWTFRQVHECGLHNRQLTARNRKSTFDLTRRTPKHGDSKAGHYLRTNCSQCIVSIVLKSTF